MSSERVARLMHRIYVWCPSVLFATQPGVWSGRITFSHALLWLMWFILLGVAIEILQYMTDAQRAVIVESKKNSDAIYQIASRQHELLLAIQKEVKPLLQDDFVSSDQIREAFERLAQCFDERE